MKPETIKAIFTNLLFVIGIILLIVGFTQSALTFTRILTFDKYPLPSYEESRCEVEFTRPLGPNDLSVAPLSPEEQSKKSAECLANIDQQRKIRQTEDVVTAVSLLFSGILLTLCFKRFILK